MATESDSTEEGEEDLPGASLVWPAVAVGGFVGLAAEVVWTRVLVFALGASAYAFSLMLTIFLVGLAAGSAIVSSLAGRLRRPVETLGWVQIAAAASIVGSTLAFVPALDAIHEGAAGTTFVQLAVAKGLALMLVPTLALGMSLPLGSRIAVRSARRVGRGLGDLYALNTLGSIAGSLAAGFVLIPVLGAQRSLLAIAALVLAAGAALVRGGQGSKPAPAAGAALAVGLVVAFALPTTILAPAFTGRGAGRTPKGDLVVFEEGRTATVTVYEDDGYRNRGALRLYTNGTSMTGTTFVGRRYMKLLGHLPVLLHPEPESVLTICFGTGMTFGATALHPEVKRSMCAELSKTVLGVAEHFGEANGDVLDRSNTRAVVGDGRQVLLSSPGRFDVITAEPPPPRDAGTYQLYSREFYRVARQRLNPGGLVAQWLPLHDQSELEVRMLARTFLDEFPHAVLFLPVATEGILIGSPDPIDVDPADLAERMGRPAVREDLAAIGIPDAASLLATFLMDARDLHRYSRLAPPLIDDRPLSDFFLDLPPAMGTTEVEWLLAYRSDVQRRWLLTPGEGFLEVPRLSERLAAHRAYLRGIVFNRRAQVLLAVQRAPDNTFYRDTVSLSRDQRAALEEQIEREPTSPALRFTYARVLLSAGEHDRAVAELEAVRDGMPTAFAWFNLGYGLEQAGRLDEARAAYGKAEELDPGIRPVTGPQLAALDALQGSPRDRGRRPAHRRARRGRAPRGGAAAGPGPPARGGAGPGDLVPGGPVARGPGPPGAGDARPRPGGPAVARARAPADAQGPQLDGHRSTLGCGEGADEEDRGGRATGRRSRAPGPRPPRAAKLPGGRGGRGPGPGAGRGLRGAPPDRGGSPADGAVGWTATTGGAAWTDPRRSRS